MKPLKMGRNVACEVYGTHGAPKFRPYSDCLKCRHHNDCWEDKPDARTRKELDDLNSMKFGRIR